MLTQDEIKNLLALISIAPIKGGEAMTVALLQNKLQKMLEPEVKEEKAKEKKNG